MSLQKIVDANEIVVPSTRPKNPRLALLQLAKMHRYYNGDTSRRLLYSTGYLITHNESPAEITEFYNI